MQFFFEELAGNALGAFCNVFGRSCAYDVTTVIAPVGTEVDDVVGTFHDVKIVFDNQDGVTATDECVEGRQETADVMKMETRSWFVEDEEGRGLSFLSYEIGEFHALVFTSGECR